MEQDWLGTGGDAAGGVVGLGTPSPYLLQWSITWKQETSGNLDLAGRFGAQDDHLEIFEISVEGGLELWTGDRGDCSQ